MSALNITSRSREEADALHLDNSRPFHPFTRPRSRLVSLLPALQQYLVSGGLDGSGEAGASLPHKEPPVGTRGRAQLDPLLELDCLGRLIAELSVSSGQWISYSRKKDWYSMRKQFGLLPESVTCNRLGRLVDLLRAAGMVDHVQGYKARGHGYQSLLRPCGEFWNVLERQGGLTEADAPSLTEADPTAPLVVVKDEDGNPASPESDDAFSVACRDVQQVREFMRSFVISAPAKPGIAELHQVFNSAALDRGGRYFGWWQNLSQDDRLHILLDGSPVAELDYRENHPSILYHGLGLLPPAESYSVEGVDRGLVKATFGRMLNSRNEAGTRRKMVQELGSRELADRIVDRLLSIHRPLVEAGKFWSGVGLTLMRKDAEIAVLVMKWARFSSVPMLPVHDSFVIRKQDAEACKAVMIQTYNAHMGIDPMVRLTQVGE